MQCKLYQLSGEDNKRDLMYDVPYRPSAKFSGQTIKPTILLIHFTASTFESAEREFDGKGSDGARSIHFLIGRDGVVVQKVPLDRAAWHAGAESRIPLELRPKGVKYPPDQSVNFQSIGIELANEGPLTLMGNGKFKTWYGKTVPPAEVAGVDAKSPGAYGVGHWHAYTQEQLETTMGVARCLVGGLGLREILGHSDVLNGKRDPGPLFPMRAFRSRLFGRDG